MESKVIAPLKDIDLFKKRVTFDFLASLSHGVNQLIDYLEEIDKTMVYNLFMDISTKNNLVRPDRMIQPSDFADSTEESCKSSVVPKKDSLLRFLHHMEISMNDVVRYLFNSNFGKYMLLYYQTKFLALKMQPEFKPQSSYHFGRLQLEEGSKSPYPYPALKHLALATNDYGRVSIPQHLIHG